MIVMLVLGPMSVIWMATVTLVPFAEKVLPIGTRFVVPVTVALVALAVWVAVDPATVPGLSIPT